MVKIVCGLGNPGPRYELTRHNLGFMVIDRLAKRLNLSREQRMASFLYWKTSVGGGEIVLVKPCTYVNRSGLAVADALARFAADPTELLVINDDYHLPLGALRIRKSGSSGGHRGLDSVIDELAREDFIRMRVGIGPLPEWARVDREKIPYFVLSQFEPDEEKIVTEIISQAVEALELIFTEGLDLAISRYNKVNPTPGS